MIARPAEADTENAARSPLRSLAAGLTAVAALCVLAATMLLVADHRHFVRRLTIVNPTSYDAALEVTGPARDGWMPVWIVDRAGTAVAEEVYDVGDTWIFRVQAQGETSAEFPVSRADLVADRWRVTIPAWVEHQLLDKGAPAPP